ncbi:Anaerobic nitric oxide reductase transcription regulator NorR [Rhodanobacter lindaniclasticus]
MLVLGENGTGKGVIAQQLHAQSLRAAKPLVKVNMGAIAENVFESEMFGHVRGAYTDAKSERIGRFELADGGTLFLDEVGNVPISQQPKLLRVLEDGEFERLGSSRTQSAECAGRSRPPMPISRSRWRWAASARICCIASTRWRSACRRCASAAPTFCRWRAASSNAARRVTVATVCGWRRRLSARCWRGAGRATCASWAI